ncbi:hypothetical protein [Scytonema sp. NUACC26]
MNLSILLGGFVGATIGSFSEAAIVFEEEFEGAGKKWTAFKRTRRSC